MIAYFYCDSFYNPDLAYHDFVCMAEGLNELGFSCYGDRNMYKTSLDGSYLIKYDKNYSWQDADLVFFHFHIYKNGKDRANNIIEKIAIFPNRKYHTVFIDADDGLRTPGYNNGAQSCDIVLKSHYNRKYHYPQNFHPWQFGVSNRILNAVHPMPFDERINAILVNFRAKHQLRDYLNKLLRPIFEQHMTWDNSIDTKNEQLSGNDLLYWKQTGGRHYPAYYNKLSTTKFCACYGGVFAISWGNYNKYTARIAREINDVLQISKWDRVRQWDSWRLWEAWAAGCCVIHVDFDKYGCTLPVMPKNGINYIGIDIDKIDKIADILQENNIESIAENGRQFVLDNYSPKAIGERLLKLINKN